MSRSARRRANVAQSNRVVVGFLSRDITDNSFQMCLRAMEKYDENHSGRIVDVLNLTGSDGRLASARNELVSGFLYHPLRPEWLLMLDDDMVFAATLADDLVEAANVADRPIVGGLCFVGGKGTVRPTISVMVSNDPPVFDTVWNYPENALCACDYTGAAALLVHRRVYEDLGARYADTPQRFFAEATLSGKEYGEDVVFCMRARAAGYPIFVHTGIKLGHMKMAPLDETEYLRYRRGITEHGEDTWAQMERARRFIAMPVTPGVISVEEVA